MTPEVQKGWDNWARSIADQRAQLQCNALSEAIVDTLGKRIADLEREVRHLKGIAPDREEWPLRAIEGGRCA